MSGDGCVVKGDCSCVDISLLKEVISVRDDLLGEAFSLFVVSQTFRSLMYCCRLAGSVSELGLWEKTVRSSACDLSCVFGSMGDGTLCI